MSVGIMTFHGAHNYGAMLQAFALQSYIKTNIDQEVQIIDFLSKEDINLYSIFKRPTSIKGCVREVIKIFFYRQLLSGHKSFKGFIRKYMYTTDRYCSYQELVLNPPKFEYYISGSDQVFSPRGREMEAFYLNFGFNDTKRIAYAPSFGYNFVPSEKKELISRLLKRFNHLSSRECSGCEIIEDLIGVKVQNVLDPVFLLKYQQYHAISKPVKMKHKNFILSYSLVGLNKQITLAKKLKELTGLPVILLKPTALLPIKGVKKIIRTAGPLEFLWLFENASYVITDSFHGTAFSIIFQKNFFSTITFQEKAERILNILTLTGLENRIVNFPNDITQDTIVIDYNSVKEKLDREIEISKEFLHNAFK